MSNEQTIQELIEAKGMTAPRITPADIEANIVGCYYFTAEEGARQACLDSIADIGGPEPIHVKNPLRPELGLLTICVLVLRNGFTVTGESACASPENFDAEIGRRVARQNAVNKIWPLMGYALKQRLSESSGSDS